MGVIFLESEVKKVEQNRNLNVLSDKDKERVLLIQKQAKKTKYQDIMLSTIGILGFLIIWQVIAVSGIIESRYLSTPLQIINLFITKLTDPNPDGAVIGVNILSSLTVALSGFGLAIDRKSVV